jgi:hypothetical protein
MQATSPFELAQELESAGFSQSSSAEAVFALTEHLRMRREHVLQMRHGSKRKDTGSTSQAGPPIVAAMGVRTRGLDIKAGAAKAEGEPGRAPRGRTRHRSLESRLATGRDMLWSPSGPRAQAQACRSAMARCVLSGLRGQPGHRCPHPRPAPTGLGGHVGTWPTVLVMSGIGTNPEVAGALRSATTGESTQTLASMNMHGRM